jgi:SAM-dependent methyltransferase
VEPAAGSGADWLSGGERRARTGRAHFEVGDAQALRFEGATFDHTLALLVMNFIPNHERAIAEIRRVTRPGGRVSACVWDYGEGMTSLRRFWDAAVALDPAIEPKDERHMMLCRAGELGDLWWKLGLVEVQEAALAIAQAFSSFADFWEPFTMGIGPAGAYVQTLSGERRRQLSSRLRERILQDRVDGPFVLRARAWGVTGEVPQP